MPSLTWWEEEVELPLKDIDPRQFSYYAGLLDSIAWNIRKENHDFRLPYLDVYLDNYTFPFNYYHFCLVSASTDSDAHILFFRPYFIDTGDLFIKAYCTEDDEGLPKEEWDNRTNWDFDLAKSTQAQLEDQRKRSLI